MAQIYRATGERIDIEPKNRKYFSLKELQRAVSGSIEIATARDNSFCIVLDAEGKIKDKPLNSDATYLYQEYIYKGDYIVGDALICSPKQII